MIVSADYPYDTYIDAANTYGQATIWTYDSAGNLFAQWTNQNGATIPLIAFYEPEQGIVGLDGNSSVQPDAGYTPDIIVGRRKIFVLSTRGVADWLVSCLKPSR